MVGSMFPQPLLAWSLGVFLVLTGISHFVILSYFDRLVPRRLASTRMWVYLSGVGEVAVGAALIFEFSGPFAAWAATGMMAVYVATHIEALLKASTTHRRWLDRPSGASARVVVNLLYLLWAVVVTISA